MEKWKDVKNYEGIYQISNYGRLKRFLKFRPSRNYQEKILQPSKDKDGYLRTTLTDKNKKRKNKTIHRLVAQAFLKNPKNKPCVNHIDGNKQNNNVKNLEWVTVRENNIHAINLGLAGQQPGEKHHMAKLTQKEVDEIRYLYRNTKTTQNQLAEKYKVSQGQIWRIINNVRWNKN